LYICNSNRFQMTTLTLKINERTKAGKAFLAMTSSLVKESKSIEIVTSSSSKEESPYNPEFVAMIKKAEKRGNYITVDPKNIWGSLGLK
jgi:hypothetical protein